MPCLAALFPNLHEQEQLQFVTLLQTKKLKHHMESITYIPSKLPDDTELASSRSPPASK